MKDFKDLTIFFISYFSTSDIRKLIKKIDKRIRIIVIDNAREKNFKKKLGNFRNVKIIKTNYNTGQVGGINIGFKKIKTKYAIYMDPDVDFKKSTIKNFLQKAIEIQDFIILAPQHERKVYKDDFISKRENKYKHLNLMKIVHGHFLFFNMKNVKKVGMYDKKIWMYYDETDYCLRAYRKNQKIYVIPSFKVRHKGGSSIKSGKTLHIEAHHRWHYMWSKFYYFKKNYSTIKAYKKTLPDLMMSLIKFLFFFSYNKRKRVIYFNAISGLINSYFNRKSYKRPLVN